MTKSVLTPMLLSMGLLLAAAADIGAQTTTGFLGVAGLVTIRSSGATDSSNVAVTDPDGITVTVRNSATGKVESTLTPSVTGAQKGFYFVALSDFSGNRAAKEGDSLAFTAARASSGASIGVFPVTTVLSAADVSASLLKINLQLGGAAVDNTPPGATLSYPGATASAVSPGSQLNITADFDEDIVDGTISIAFTGPTTAAVTGGNMTKVTAKQYTFVFAVPSAQGTYTVAISGAKDSTGNTAGAPKNNAFRVGSAVTAPVVTIGAVAGAKGGTVKVPISLTNVAGVDVGGIQSGIDYDETKLKFVSGSAGAALGTNFSVAVNDSTPVGKLTLVVFGTTAGAIPSGDVVSLEFTVNSTAAAGDSALTPVDTQVAVKPDGDTIAGSSFQAGKISIGGATVAGKCEDVTGDKLITVSDALRIINVIVGRRVAAGNEDVTGDNDVTVSDALRVVNVIVGRRTMNGNCAADVTK